MLKRRIRKIGLTALLIVVAAVVLTSLTWFYGVADVLRYGANDLNTPPQQSYASRANTVGPCLIRLEHGWLAGPLRGRGETVIYFWFFGFTRKISVLDEWSA